MIEVSIYHPIGKLKVDKDGNQTEPEKDKVKIEFVLPRRPFLFWASKRLGEQVQFPKGYGVAYYDAVSAKILMAPMPFNVLVGFAIWCYQWTRYGAEYWLYRHWPNKKE